VASILIDQLALFHVTPRFNQPGIIATGVDPERSRGKRPLSWWVERERLEWAMMHVSAKYAISVGGLWVAEARVPSYICRRTKMNAVFTIGVIVRPLHMYNASHYMTDSF